MLTCGHIAYSIIGDDVQKLKEAAVHCDVTVDKLDEFIRGQNISFDKGRELCDFLCIDEEKIYPGYFISDK